MKASAIDTGNPHARVQDLHGELAWPTLAMFAAGVGLFALGTAAVLAWGAHWLVGLAVNALALYLLFTPAHEAVHGNIVGRSALPRWVESSVGWVSAGAFLFPYPIFSYDHRTHHKHTNHPERDPDFWVAGKQPLKVLLSCMSMLPDYYYFYFSRTRALLANPRERSGYIASVLFLVGVVAVFVAYGQRFGYWAPALLWFAPALLASTFLAYIFDYLPHRPHREQRRYLDTRITLFPGLTTLFVSQNLHLIHHLYPSIPYYRYAEAFERIRPDLEAKGARIDDLGEALTARERSSAAGS